MREETASSGVPRVEAGGSYGGHGACWNLTEGFRVH